ncbi:hypothetical protein LX12_002003 [Williamsia serinedens]|uniref:Uncharacterized protein n=2 Tax=Williamsia serinedens TaxID=391736 RepID=A0ABT1H0Z9_9NOCA|nr:hypothetical protein [Williamsia serinedens]
MPVTATHTSLVFEFPQIAEDAGLSVTFHRTLRVPDDETTYGLPPSLGAFSLSNEREGAGILMPMWQSEACWLSFSTSRPFDSMPFLVKVGAGSVNAVTGGRWTPEPDFEAEDYFEVPEQPWLDGFCTGHNVVRQFVAMPLGGGYTVEEQLVDAPATGGIHLSVYPLKKSVWEQRSRGDVDHGMVFNCCGVPGDMGLGAGGSITQSIATPVEPHDNWDLTAGLSTFVRTVNTQQWQAITGEPPHTSPLTIEEYRAYGFPWFERYDDTLARQGSESLAAVSTVRQVGAKTGHDPLPDNGGFDPPKPIVVGP